MNIYLIVFIVLILFGSNCHSNEKMNNKLKLVGIVISEESYNSEKEYEIIYSNIVYLNTLFSEYISLEEVSDDALKSYYVDYYLSQLNNGGFSQFIFNSGWKNDTIRYIRDGLKEMGATKNLDHFNRSVDILNGLGSERINEFLESEYFGTNEVRDILNTFDDVFFSLQENEDLVHLNAQWLKQYGKLEILTEEEISNKIRSIALSIPDRDSRIQKALENEPRYYKLIRALCKKAGQKFKVVTAGNPTNQYKDQQVFAWHFLTESGHYYMIEYDGQAIMFSKASNEIFATIPANEKYGS